MKKINNYLDSIKAPTTVMISPTDSCNLSCLMCWRRDKKEDPNLKKTELSLAQIKRIIKDCNKIGVKHIDLTGGGEAFIRKDIFEIIEYVKKNNMTCSLTTNATLLNSEKIKKLVDINLDEICFSIESLKEDINDSIRGKGTLQKSLSAIQAIGELKKENQKPLIRISTVITNKNYEHLESLIDFAIQNKISAINFSVLLEWESNKDISMKNEDSKKVLKILKDLEKKSKNKLYTNLPSIIKHGLFEHDVPKFCFAPWDMIFINSSGEVMACCTLSSFYQNIIGNVKTNSLIDIWNGEKMNNFRNKMKQGKFFPECNRCLPEFIDMFDKKFKEL